MPDRDAVESFIRSTFQSVWSLELLRFLRPEPERAWNQGELVAGLRASDLVVSQSLAALSAGGLVVLDADGDERYIVEAKAIVGDYLERYLD